MKLLSGRACCFEASLFPSEGEDRRRVALWHLSSSTFHPRLSSSSSSPILDTSFPLLTHQLLSYYLFHRRHPKLRVPSRFSTMRVVSLSLAGDTCPFGTSTVLPGATTFFRHDVYFNALNCYYGFDRTTDRRYP